MVLWSLRRHALPVWLLGGGLVLLHHWTLFYSDKLMADIPIATATMVAAGLLAGFRYHGKPAQAPWYALGWAFALMYGFLAKGNILLTLPLWAWWLGEDLLAKRHRQFWGWAMGWSLLLMGGYLLSLYGWTGDPLSRVRAIAANAYQNACSYELQPASVLWHRIGPGWSLNLLLQGSWPGLVLLLSLLRKPFGGGDPERRFWLQGSLVLVLAANFMSISIDHYQPMCIGVRHYLYLIPVVAVAVAPALWDLLRGARAPWLAAGLMLLAAGIAVWQGYQTGWWLYAPLAGVLLLRGILPRRTWLGPALVGLWLLGLSLFPGTLAWQAHDKDYPGRRDLVLSAFPAMDPALPVLTDKVWSRLGPYYQSFGDDAFRYYAFDALDTLALAPPFYLLIDGRTQYLSGLKWESLPYFAQSYPPTASRLVSDEARGIYVMRIDSLPAAELLARYHLEEAAPVEPMAWAAAPTDEAAQRALVTDEATPPGQFTLALDSLGIDPQRTLVVRATFMAWKRQDVPLRWVLSLHRDQQLMRQWELPFDPLLLALTTWWPVRLETVMPPSTWGQSNRLTIGPSLPAEGGILRVDSASVELRGW
jgi:hypothetical protein